MHLFQAESQTTGDLVLSVLSAAADLLSVERLLLESHRSSLSSSFCLVFSCLLTVAFVCFSEVLVVCVSAAHLAFHFTALSLFFPSNVHLSVAGAIA